MKGKFEIVNRVLCIISSLDAGGAETFLMKVYRALPPEEYQFDFIVSDGNGCYTQEVLDRGGRVYQIPLRTRNLIGAFRGIVSAVKENGYGCVLKLANTPIAAVDLVAARLGGAKRLAMRSCNALTGLSGKEKALNAVLRPLLNGIANVKIAPSMLAAEFTFGKRRAHRDVHLLNNGVDLGVYRFSPEGRDSIRKEFSIEGKLVVGHVGRLHKQKNHRFLLEVFHEIKVRRPDAVLLLVGTGELEEDIRRRAEELGLADSVIFTGVRFDVPQLLSAMDVFVFPSFHEGMPNTVIEAQATGLPCVIADTITPEADITGLVQYLPLEQNTAVWADTALAAVKDTRADTAQDIIDHGYDIQTTAQTLVSLLFSE